jgi:hypothetical protein
MSWPGGVNGPENNQKEIADLGNDGEAVGNAGNQPKLWQDLP